MKKILFAFTGVLLSVGAAIAASSVADLSSGPAKREQYNAAGKGSAPAARRVKSDANLYYITKAKRGDTIYKDFNGCTAEGCDKSTRSVRAETKKAESDRKYNLNNPFYQPEKMGFASVTDLSYTYNALDFKTDSAGNISWRNRTGDYSAQTISATENLSFGITDDISAIVMGRFASSNLKIHWDQPTSGPQNDKQSDSKFDLWGIGAQWRFINNADWIASALAAYQKIVDAANVFSGEAKLGYKNDDTTIYGLARVQMLDWDGTGYGFGVKNDLGQTVYFTQNETAKSSTYYDLGIGIFAAMNSDWSADAQLLYSGADWHSQISGKFAVSYQPWKNAALSLYGKIALWDNADDFDESSVYEIYQGAATRQTGAAFDNYTDLSLGALVTVAF